QQKRVTLTGTRPFFVDLPKKASLDSAQEIRVFLKPRPSPPAEAGSVAAAQASIEGLPETRVAAKLPEGAPAGDAFATGASPRTPTGAGGSDDGTTLGLGDSLQIERILAYRDVHFKAPNRYMEARTWLDAPFIEVDPMPATESTTEPKVEGSPAPAAGAEGPPAPGAGEGAPKAADSKAA